VVRNFGLVTDGLIDVSGHELRLIGGQCGHCGYVFFPKQSFGCERCGHHAGDITTLSLSSRGSVEVSALVHHHADPRRPPPFVVAQVLLDGGPRVRALAEGDAELAGGTRVEGRLLPAADDAEPHFGFRFARLLDGQR
jgi:hypothetical protein